jgi:hypothetical protein
MLPGDGQGSRIDAFGYSVTGAKWHILDEKQ